MCAESISSCRALLLMKGSWFDLCAAPTVAVLICLREAVLIQMIPFISRQNIHVIPTAAMTAFFVFRSDSIRVFVAAVFTVAVVRIFLPVDILLAMALASITIGATSSLGGVSQASGQLFVAALFSLPRTKIVSFAVVVFIRHSSSVRVVIVNHIVVVISCSALLLQCPRRIVFALAVALSAFVFSKLIATIVTAALQVFIRITSTYSYSPIIGG